MPTAVMPCVTKESCGGAHAGLVERPQLLAEEIEPAADLADITQRHDALRLHPEIGVAIALRHRLAGDFQDMAEALGDDQARDRRSRPAAARWSPPSYHAPAPQDRPRRRPPRREWPARRAPAQSRDLAGVDDTLVTRIAPELSSTQTMSVKVPPVSMPIRSLAPPLITLRSVTSIAPAGGNIKHKKPACTIGLNWRRRADNGQGRGAPCYFLSSNKMSCDR